MTHFDKPFFTLFDKETKTKKYPHICLQRDFDYVKVVNFFDTILLRLL